MKTTMSRFQIHDDLTAPDGSLPVFARSSRDRRAAAELSRRAGRFAAALRGYARFRAELKARNARSSDA